MSRGREEYREQGGLQRGRSTRVREDYRGGGIQRGKRTGGREDYREEDYREEEYREGEKYREGEIQAVKENGSGV